MPNQQFNDRQSRFAKAFSRSSTLCSVDCGCGKVYFVSTTGHGDYEEGELERYQEMAKAEPDKYIEEWTYDSVDYFYEGGKTWVIDCQCGHAERIAKWIEGRADAIIAYLKLYFAAEKEDAERQVNRATSALASLEPMPGQPPLPDLKPPRQFSFGKRSE